MSKEFGGMEYDTRRKIVGAVLTCLPCTRMHVSRPFTLHEIEEP